MWFLGEDEQSQEKICYYLRFNCMHDNWLLRGDVHIELYKIWKKCKLIIKKSSTNKEISFSNYTFVSIYWIQFEFLFFIFWWVEHVKKGTSTKISCIKKILLQLVKLTNYYQIISIFRALCGAATKVYRAVTK